jgi:chemotaxis protein histidine kinase CheA
MQELRNRYMATVRQVAEELRAVAARLAANPADDEALQQLARTAHRVKGSAGSYGFHAASAAMQELETRVSHWLTDTSIESAERFAAVERLIDTFVQSFDNG